MIYEVDDQQGRALIALEFVEGTTLKHRIAGLPLVTELLAALASVMLRMEKANSPTSTKRLRVPRYPCW